MITIIFILIFLLFYTYFAYPVVLRVLNRFFANPVKYNDKFSPDISVVISAYNEEDYIKDAILSVFDSGYYKDKLKLYVGSDGCNDNTLKILYELQTKFSNLFVYDYPRSGKNQTLNKLVPKTTTDYIFFMDADCRTTKNIFNQMIKYFADEQVGIVLGSSVHIASEGKEKDTGRMGDVSYHSFERNMRLYEGNIQSTVNSFGPLYGIRRDVYEPIPNDKVCDDFLPILKTVEKDKRVIFNPEGFAYEVRPKTLKDEFHRRIRSVSCGMASLWMKKNVMSPKYKWVPFFLLSHKILRWVTPFILLLLAFGTMLISDQSVLKAPFIWIQIAFYIVAIIGWGLEKIKIKIFPFNTCLFFIIMNVGMLFAFFRFMAGMSNAIWSRETIKEDKS